MKKNIQSIEQNIKYLEQETEKYKDQILGDNIWIENLKSKRT